MQGVALHCCGLWMDQAGVTFEGSLATQAQQLKGVVCVRRGRAGLIEDTEVGSMRGLVEQKLKKLHYFPPAFRVQPPHTLLAAHPLLADVPPPVFRRKARLPQGVHQHRKVVTHHC